jgi:hypothetical protein
MNNLTKYLRLGLRLGINSETLRFWFGIGSKTTFYYWIGTCNPAPEADAYAHPPLPFATP